MKRILSLVLAAVLVFALAVPAFAEQNPDCGAKLIAITFDDGPSIYTDRLLDGLKARNAKATFFVAGYMAVNYPDVLQRIVDEGHQLANHTYNHKNLNTLSDYGVQQEVSSTRKLLVEAGGEQTYYIRPPYGNANSTVKANADAPLIIWSVDPVDWDNKNADVVCNNIVRGSFDGGIILVHDLYKTSVNGALAAIDILQSYGYEFVTVEELFQRRGVTPEAGQLYYSAKNQGINLSKWQISNEYYDEDLMPQHWGYDALKFSLDRGYLLPGTVNGYYLPNVPITRGEFVQALAKLSGVTEDYGAEEACVFADLGADSKWLPWAKWAWDTGVILGADGSFLPDTLMTREQLACVLQRFTGIGEAEKQEEPEAADAEPAAADALPEPAEDVLPAEEPAEEEQPVQEPSLLSCFTDEKEISFWAYDSVEACYRSGLMVGVGGDRFDPLGSFTRAQAATVLQRLAAAMEPAPEAEEVPAADETPDAGLNPVAEPDAAAE